MKAPPEAVGWPQKAAHLLRWLQHHPGPHHQLKAREVARLTGLAPREVGQILGRLEGLQVQRHPRQGHGNGANTWNLQLAPPPGKPIRTQPPQEGNGHGHREE